MDDDTYNQQREGLSLPEVEAISGFGKTTIGKAIANKQLVARKNGKRTIVLREDLMEFLKSLPRAEYSRRVA
jgi:hypothetical protein